MPVYKQLGFSDEQLREFVKLINEGKIRPKANQTYADAYLDYKENLLKGKVQSELGDFVL